jgi:hypothetical protein
MTDWSRLVATTDFGATVRVDDYFGLWGWTSVRQKAVPPTSAFGGGGALECDSGAWGAA